MRALIAIVVLQAGAARADSYADRIAKEAAELRHALEQHCPARADEIARLAKVADGDRAAALARLAACGKTEPLYHQTLGSAYLAANDFKAAEASFRKQLALAVTEAGQVGLLMSLVRQPKLDAAQQADVRKHLEYFRAHACTRDDLCAALAYVGFHLEDAKLTRASADTAIALGFAGWQPYLFGGAAYAIAPQPDRAKARRMLTEAKKRGAPAADVDDLLHDLGAP